MGELKIATPGATTQQRICVYGAGAIGGLLAAKLATTDAKITCIARGEHLKSIQTNGLLLIDNNEEIIYDIDATDEPDTLPTQDIVFVSLKTHALAANAEQIAGLLAPDCSRWVESE